MTGLRTLVGMMARLTAGLGTAVAVALLVPVFPMASADPASDADAAIGQAWDAGGGPGGSLGMKDGEVYAAGAGFGQNFAGGKIFFTPDTGAHIMQGAILDKYMALGGPADGDLGFPNIDEGGGLAPDSRNTTFSAADEPVIFWTPDTGAHVVRGALNAAWDKLGGSAGVLGVPSEDEVYRGDVVSQDFTGGQLSWNRKTGAFTSTPPELADQLAGLVIPGDATTAINAARRAAGGPMGPLGVQEGAEYKIGDDGVGQNFAGGKIFYSPATGANVLTGQVLAKYESVGGPQGDLGLPTSDEGDGGLAPESKIVTFAAADQPVIFWTPDFGAVIVRGAMNAAWSKLGGAAGELGAPTADQTENGDVITQKFGNGAISWNKTTKEFSTEPTDLASKLAGLEVPAFQPPQVPPPGDVSTAEGSKWYQWHAWWLLIIVPVAVLAAVAVGVLLNRRRRDDSAPMDRFDGDLEDHDDVFDDAGLTDHHEPDSGPLPDGVREDEGRYAPAIMWAMPVDSGGRGADVSGPELGGAPSDDQDSIDTAPTMIESEMEPTAEPEDEFDWESEPEDDWESEPEDDWESEPEGEDEDVDVDVEPASGPPSGRHAATQIDEPAPAQTSMRLATDDPFSAPDGYPIKADTTTGLYWAPGSAQYDDVRAEIWFASEEFALTNGFVKG